ncbi:MAG TPA: hypothetical protein VJ776_04940 [Thermoanaerobaculia bacterium]|jgi:hypothetical protein|nr:hypothetical protein [Thermoanaerobaculia bacterium]
MKDETMKKILWILAAIGLCLVAVALLADPGAERAAPGGPRQAVSGVMR